VDAWIQINWKLERELHEERFQMAILENRLRSVRDKLQAEMRVCEYNGRVAMIAEKMQTPAVSTATSPNENAKGPGEHNHQKLMVQHSGTSWSAAWKTTSSFRSLSKKGTQSSLKLDSKEKTLRPGAPPAAPKSSIGSKRHRSPEITTVASINAVPQKKAKHRAHAGFDSRRAR
jgi:hypothetical protein